MGNHRYSKWAQISLEKKAWIYSLAKKEYTEFINTNGKLPEREEKQIIINRVYEKLIKRGISIPLSEVGINIGRYINIKNKQNALSEGVA